MAIVILCGLTSAFLRDLPLRPDDVKDDDATVDDDAVDDVDTAADADLAADLLASLV